MKYIKTKSNKKQNLLNNIYLKYYMIKAGNNNENLKKELDKLLTKFSNLSSS